MKGYFNSFFIIFRILNFIKFVNVSDNFYNYFFFIF